MRAFFAALAVVFIAATSSACGPKGGDTTPAGGAGSGSGASELPTGNLGATCACGNGPDGAGSPDCAPVQCSEGLVCGYPCGIDGCDHVCMTQADADLPRP